MIRTRDYFLFLGLMLFLVSGISVSLLGQAGVAAGVQQASVYEALKLEAETDMATATTPEVAPLDRAAFIQSMRAKIAQGGGVWAQAPTDPEPLVATDPDPAGGVNDPSTALPLPTDEVWLCSSFSVSAPPALVGAEFKAEAGRRIIYRTDTVISEPVDASFAVAGEVLPAPLLTQDVVLVALPLQVFPPGQPSCIPQDVIGIALDGSYIRNKEYSTYRIFGSETLIGYALDGFPIHGLSKGVVTDRCGGAVEAGAYRYYLSDTRDVMINCFAGTPTRL